MLVTWPFTGAAKFKIEMCAESEFERGSVEVLPSVISRCPRRSGGCFDSAGRGRGGGGGDEGARLKIPIARGFAAAPPRFLAAPLRRRLRTRVNARIHLCILFVSANVPVVSR